MLGNILSNSHNVNQDYMPVLHPLLSPIAIATFCFVLSLIALLVTKTSAIFLVGLLGYVLSRHLHQYLDHRGWPQRWASGIVMAGTSIGMLALIGIGINRLLSGNQIEGLIRTTADALDHAKQYVPDMVANRVPDTAEELRAHITQFLSTHAEWLTGMSTHILQDLLLALVAWIIGIMLALAPPAARNLPEFQVTWRQHWHTLAHAFETVAFAQIKISATNAALLGVFLLVLMPLFGYNIPYARALILISFLIGLLPVIGNLIVNTLVFAIALGSSLAAAASCLIFLMLIHKFEYFLLARFVGRKTDTRAWEILVALFSCQIAFGAGGMVAAPIIYAYSKDMLKQVGWLRK